VTLGQKFHGRIQEQFQFHKTSEPANEEILTDFFKGRLTGWTDYIPSQLTELLTNELTN